MRTIAIVLADNDFEHTFRPLLENLMRVIEWHDRLSGQDKANITQEYVRRTIFSGIRYHYVSYQIGLDEEKNRLWKAEVDRIVRGLEKIIILFDEEAENDIETRDHNGGAWYLDLQTGFVYSY